MESAWNAWQQSDVSSYRMRSFTLLARPQSIIVCNTMTQRRKIDVFDIQLKTACLLRFLRSTTTDQDVQPSPSFPDAIPRAFLGWTNLSRQVLDLHIFMRTSGSNVMSNTRLHDTTTCRTSMPDIHPDIHPQGILSFHGSKPRLWSVASFQP